MAKFLFFFVYVLIVITVARLSGVKRWDILAGVVFIQFLSFLFVFFRNIVTANQWFKIDAWLSVLDKSLMIGLCSAFIFRPSFFGPMSIQKFLSTQIAATVMAILVVIIILSYKGIVFKRPALKFFDRSVIFSALPFAITIFLMSIHVRLDGFLLERMHPNGAHETGIYASAYRLLDASNMVGYLVASFFMPFIARLWSEGKPLQSTILQTRHLQLMFAVAIVSVSCMLAPWLQKILYHRYDFYGVQILQWCLPALIGYAFVQVYGTVMTATGSIVAFCYLNFAAVLINVLLNLILIPKYGAFGCCISALCSQVLLGLTTMIFIHKKLKTPLDMGSLFVYLLNGLLICGILYALLKTSINSLFLLLIAVLITFLVMWAAKMLSVNNYFGFLKKQ